MAPSVRSGLLSAIFVCLLAGEAQGAAQSSGAIPLPAARPSTQSYRIGSGDTLDVQVFGRPQLSRQGVRVDADGAIRMPLISEPIRVACLSESEIGVEIAKKYRSLLVDPDVTVSVREFGSQPVEIVGAVARPGHFQLQREVRLREMLSLAGGVQPNAAMFLQLVHDETSPGCETMGPSMAIAEETTVAAIDVAGLMAGRGENPVVRPGDFINVPQADQAFVVGHVVKPTAIALTQRITVSRAIAMAGGRQPDSKDHARVIRRKPDGTGNTDFRVDLKAIEQQGAPDVELQVGDIVEVPGSVGRQMLKVVLGSLASTGAVYYPLLIIK